MKKMILDNKYRVQDIQSTIRFLVLFLIATFVLSLVGLIVFPDPPEITAAVEVMEEFDETAVGSFSILAGLVFIFAFLVLFLWSLWQLFHLDRRGFAKLLWAMGALIPLELIFGGYWQTAPQAILETLSSIAMGVIVTICFLHPEIFTNPDTKVATEH